MITKGNILVLRKYILKYLGVKGHNVFNFLSTGIDGINIIRIYIKYRGKKVNEDKGLSIPCTILTEFLTYVSISLEIYQNKIIKI